MDLGIKGKNALVCAASKGLGRGCAETLAEAGVLRAAPFLFDHKDHDRRFERHR